MPKFEFCLPSIAKSVPAGADWLHEIKYDGYRLRLERDGDRVRLITNGGYDWTRRYPRIVEAAARTGRAALSLMGRPSSAASTAIPISTRCIQTDTMTRSS